jgi:hypothetical protein
LLSYLDKKNNFLLNVWDLTGHSPEGVSCILPQFAEN